MLKTKEQISYNMRRIKNKDSEIELILRKTLWHHGIRYRKNVKTVYGRPDIAFLSKKIAVFVDSEFWHGFDWENRKNDIKTNVDFWIPKIERNIQRDIEVNEKLCDSGWIVLRFWGSDIKKNTEACVNDVSKVLSGDYRLCTGRIFVPDLKGC